MTNGRCFSYFGDRKQLFLLSLCGHVSIFRLHCEIVSYVFYYERECLTHSLRSDAHGLTLGVRVEAVEVAAAPAIPEPRATAVVDVVVELDGEVATRTAVLGESTHFCNDYFFFATVLPSVRNYCRK